MGTTSPDLLPWPEYPDPAAIPTDMHEMANAVQVALNKKIALGSSGSGEIAPATGWGALSGWQLPRAYAYGKIVVCNGVLARTASLTVTDNGLYVIGTLPAAVRPAAKLITTVPWQVFDTGGNRQRSAAQVEIGTNGVVTLVTNAAGTMPADSSWVGLSAAWVGV